MLARLREFMGADTAEASNVSASPHQTPGEGVFASSGFAVDEYRPMRVIAIGAGMSGIVAGIRFRQYIPNLDLTIYDKEDHIGGTWYVNRYPGVACDIPAHCFQYTFENKSDWSELYSSGAEILASLEEIVRKHKLEPYIKLQHELVHAKYDEPSGKWHVRIKRPSQLSTSPDTKGEYEEFEDEADFLFMGVGLLHRWSWPDIAGLKDFKGTMIHCADWNLGGATWEEDVKDWGDKNVAVIGLGSAALQIVPALQDKVGRLSQFARGRAWIPPLTAQNTMSRLLSREASEKDSLAFTEEEKRYFANNPEKAWEFRVVLEKEMNSGHLYTIRNSEMQLQRQEIFRKFMNERLASKPEIAAKLIPDFSVAVRRISPAPAYLDSLTKDNVDFISAPIRRITANGIETEDGQTIHQDVIICATGFDVSFRYPFPMIGRNGTDLRDKWTPYPKSYLTVCIDEFPNCFFSCGPNTAAGAGSFLILIEHQVNYAVKVAAKLQRERLKSIEVKSEAVADFDEVIERYFPQTVFTEKVRTWYKMGREDGRVTGLWPGSAGHELRVLRHPRWEDFNYESLGSGKNRFYWFGNGMTVAEQTIGREGDLAWYLREDCVDVPPSPKYWGALIHLHGDKNIFDERRFSRLKPKSRVPLD